MEWDEIAGAAWERGGADKEPSEAVAKALEVFKAFDTELASWTNRPDAPRELRDAAIQFQDFLRSGSELIRDAPADIRRASKTGTLLLGVRTLSGLRDLADEESQAAFLGHVLFFAFVVGFSARLP